MSGQNDSVPESIRYSPYWKIAFDFEVLSMMFPDLVSWETVVDYLEQNKKLSLRFSILYFLCLALSFLNYDLAQFNELSIAGGFLSISGLSVSKSILSFALAVSYAYMMNAFLSMLSLGRVIDALFLKMGVHDRFLMSAKWDATMLWAHTLMPKGVGYRSGVAHVVISLIFSIVSTAMMLGILFFCCISVWVVLEESISEFGVDTFVSGAALVTVFGYTLIALLVVFFPFKYRLSSEGVGEPIYKDLGR